MKIITLNQASITDFSQTRNKFLEKVKDSWVLFLDQDETLSGPIDEAKLDRRFNYAFRRDDWFMGRWLKHGETSQVRLVRLIQPGTGQWQGKVHERFVSNLRRQSLKVKIIHKRKINLSEFIDRLNYYSELRTQEIKRFSLFELLIYPLAKFVKNYIGLLGFLDGVPGLAMAFSMSLHSLMVRIKIYEKNSLAAINPAGRN